MSRLGNKNNRSGSAHISLFKLALIKVFLAGTVAQSYETGEFGGRMIDTKTIANASCRKTFFDESFSWSVIATEMMWGVRCGV